MSTRINVAVGSLFAAIVSLCGAAILGSGTASADPKQDEGFLELLSQNGVSALSGVPSLIATAHQICSSLDSGMSADALVDELVSNANAVTPGADPARLARTEARFLAAAVEAYCPNNQGRVAFAFPTGWEPRHRVVAASVFKMTNPADPFPPLPGPEAQNLKPPQAVAPPPAVKVAPPVAGPPPGRGGGGGGNGGGSTGVAPIPPMEPGIIALAP